MKLTNKNIIKIIVAVLSFFIIFTSKEVYAAKSIRVCYYELKEKKCGGYTNEDGICTTELRIIYTEDKKVDADKTAVSGYTEKKGNVYLFQYSRTDAINGITFLYDSDYFNTSDFENKCPSEIGVYVDIPVFTRKDFIIRKKNNSNESAKLKKEVDYTLCESKNINNVKNELDNLIGNSNGSKGIGKLVNDLDKAYKAKDSELISKLSKEINSQMDVTNGKIKNYNTKYGYSSENNPKNSSHCDEYNPMIAKVMENLKAIMEKYENIVKLIGASSDISQDAKNDVMDSYEQFSGAINSYNGSGLNDGGINGCGALDPALLKTIEDIINYIKIIVPILIILFGSIDFAKAVLLDDEAALKKASTSFLKRCVAGVIIFFIPTIVSLILQMDGIKDLYTINDPLCGIK